MKYALEPPTAPAAVNFRVSGAGAVNNSGSTGLNLSDVPGVNAFPTFDFSDSTGFTPIGRPRKTGGHDPRQSSH